MMNRRRSLMLLMTTSLVALVMIAGTALADELFGTITKVDADAKKITVLEKDTDKEVVVTITDSTEYISKKGSSKVDFEKLATNLQKAKDNNKKGQMLKIEHEKGVASKITPAGKKAAPAPEKKAD